MVARVSSGLNVPPSVPFAKNAASRSGRSGRMAMKPTASAGRLAGMGALLIRFVKGQWPYLSIRKSVDAPDPTNERRWRE